APSTVGKLSRSPTVGK
ncbi:hypothetical protein A2U01_0112214, partial [Trifolium medium]|nr:hypothetical protein [Trifolium medium]